MSTILENCAKLAADNIETLRRIDVYRVLEAAAQHDQMETLSVAIRGARPDLAMELDRCRIEIQSAELGRVSQ